MSIEYFDYYTRIPFASPASDSTISNVELAILKDHRSVELNIRHGHEEDSSLFSDTYHYLLKHPLDPQLLENPQEFFSLIIDSEEDPVYDVSPFRLHKKQIGEFAYLKPNDSAFIVSLKFDRLDAEEIIVKGIREIIRESSLSTEDKLHLMDSLIDNLSVRSPSIISRLIECHRLIEQASAHRT